MNNSELIDKLKKENQQLKDFADEVSQRAIEQLNSKPSDNEWSVLECFDHMNSATELYLDQIEEKIGVLKPEKIKTYKKTLFARMFTKQLAPTDDGIIKGKMKTMKLFYPAADLDIATINTFKNNLDRFLSVLVQVEGKDLRSFKVTTALGAILKFYLGDALDFIHAHNRRHAIQIEHILQKLQENDKVTV